MPPGMGEDSQYQRGLDAGRIEARLAEHDRHLAAINGSVADSVAELRKLRGDVGAIATRKETDDAIKLAISSQSEVGITARQRQVAIAAFILLLVSTINNFTGVHIG